MPLAPNGPIALHGAPLTPAPPTGPHKPNLAIQARLAPELISAIVEARKKGLDLQFEAFGPNAGFHIDGQHFPIHSVAAERTPHEVYAYTALPHPTLQVVGKVAGRCGVQRTLTEEDQERLLQSRSAAENASTRTIGRIGVPDAPAKTGEKKKPAVRKGVLTASSVATALRASPAPGTAGNSPPPGAPARPNDGPPNAFQQLLIHHLAFAPSTLKQLSATLKRQPKEIRPCLDSIATSDDTTTGPRPDAPTWTLRPSSYQYLRLAPATGAAPGGHWLTLSPDDIKRITADANRAFDELKLPPDAPPRQALAAQQPAQPAPPTPAPPAPSAKTNDSTLKHPLPARPTPTATPNGRLDVPKPSRVPSPADAPSREMSVDAPRVAPARPPVRPTPKEKPKAADDSEALAKKAGAVKSKSGVNGKEKPKPKSKPIITADSDGEDFVATKRDRERKPPPVAAPAPTPTPPIRAPVLHSRAGSSSSSKQAEPVTGAKRPKRDADIALELERELDSGYSETSRPVAPPTTSTTKPPLEGKKRRIDEDVPRVREREQGAEGVKRVEKPKVKVKVRERPVGATGQAERLVAKEEVKRKRRDADQDSDASYGSDIKKKRRVESTAATPVPTKKREKPPREREPERESESSAVEARPKKPLPVREPDVRVREKPRKTATTAAKTNGAASGSTPASQKTNGSSKKDRASVMYTSSEDEGTPAPRRTAPAPTTAPPAARVPKPPAPSPSDVSTPRERVRERDRRKPPPEAFVLPSKRPPLPATASAADVRDRYSEVYAEYMSMNARLASERVKVQKLLRDMDEGDHEAVDTSLVESLTKAYREAHEELVALKERLAGGA